MDIRFRLRHALLLATAAWAVPAVARAVSPATAQSPSTAILTTWENQGSDVPVDPTWRFGTLTNGVRYAVRRGTQPPGAIAVRVRIGVGALMESEGQQGWTHLLEHMVFRGTEHYADGEGIKLWQRLGASFGSDTNAATTHTSTTFQLDLPHSDASGYNQAMGVLAEMMDSARLDPALLSTERQVVDAERSQRLTPLLRKLRDVQQPLVFAGTKVATSDLIGTSASLAAASPASLKAYYKKWYRPENAVVVVAGDADPAVLEAGVRRAFGGWKASGARPADPDWGAPRAPRFAVAIMSDPQAPETVVIDFVSPHPDRPFTLARQREQFTEIVALGILNQRFATAARRGEAILNAGAQRAEQRHVEDQLVVSLQPKLGQWPAALNQAFAILNGATASPPEQAEIDQQTANMTTALAQGVTSASTQTSPSLASSVINNFERGDVAAAPDFYATFFAALRPTLTPAAVQQAMRRLLVPAPRLLVVTPAPVQGGEATAISALANAQKVAGGHSASLRSVSLDQLKLAGQPARVVAITAIQALGAERVRFSNGVELVFKRTSFEKDRVRVLVQVGRGLLGEPRNQQGLWWTATALAAGGLGPFNPEEFARVTAGRQIGFGIGPGLDALSLAGISNAADVGEMLKLMTGEITQPRFDATAVARLKESVSASYAYVFSQPTSVLGGFGGAALHGGDERFLGLPSLAAIGQLTAGGFQNFWTERLAQGPVRLVVVGDVDRDQVTAAVGRTLGTLSARVSKSGAGADVRATPPAQPLVLRHRGDPGQALVLRAFPTLGDLEDPSASAALDLAATIVQTRLTEGFRATEGGTYTPSAAHSQSTALPHYGLMLAGAQVQSARVEAFGRSLDAVLADLATNGPSADAFARAQATALSAAERRRADNGWWTSALSGELSSPRIDALAGVESALKALNPGKIKAAAAHYLLPSRGFTVEVLPTTAGVIGKAQ